MYNIVFEVSELGLMSVDTTIIYDSFNYMNWYNRNDNYRLYFSTRFTDKIYERLLDLLSDINDINIDRQSIIPVGSIEFVERYLGKPIRAINIPESIRSEKFTGRKIWVGDIGLANKLLDSYNKLFIKDTDECKKFEACIYDARSIPDCFPKTLFISEYIDIIAEYRAFVHNGKILDCRQYLGDYKCKFDDRLLDEMVIALRTNNIKSYTLDIGVTNRGETVVIEVHNFISCGLYGFEQLNKIANMVISAYNQEKDGVIR